MLKTENYLKLMQTIKKTTSNHYFLYFEVDFIIGKRGLGCSVGVLEWWGRLQAPGSRLQALVLKVGHRFAPSLARGHSALVLPQTKHARWI